jgi:hypothetical protein
VSDEEYRKPPSLDTVKNHIIEDLKEKYAEGLLGVTEFENLLEKTQQVRNREELAALAEQLPDLREDETEPYTREHSSDRSGNTHRGTAHQKEAAERSGEAPDQVDNIVTFMGDNRRDGVWKPAKHIKVLVVMGDVDIDFTEAILPETTIYIDFITVMGDLDIVIPEGVNVQFGGTPLLSSHKNKTSKRFHEGRPTIKLSGFSLMADVVVRER